MTRRSFSKATFILFLSISFSLAVFFRSFNYTHRISIENDNSRDAQVAQYAADHNKIPLIGQYSSSGPFFYGPWWYWILMSFSKIPLGRLTLWYCITYLSFIYLLLLYKLGTQIYDKWTGAIMVFMGSVVEVQMSNFIAVWNPVIIPLFSVLILLLLIRCFKYNSSRNYFILGFLLGLSVSIHFQSMLLLPILIIAALLNRSNFKRVFLMIFGFILPFSTLIYFDMTHKWINLTNFFRYLTIGQYTIYVPNRWLTYLSNYWPETWGRIVGGPSWVGGLIIFTVLFTLILNFKSVIKNKKLLLIISSFAAATIILRYYRGYRFPYLSLFALPFVTLFTSLTIRWLFNRSRPASLILFMIIAFFSLKNSLASLHTDKIAYKSVLLTLNKLYLQYPDKSFAVYGCSFTEGSTIAHPMAYFMYLDKKDDPNGLKIGFCSPSENLLFSYKILTERDFNEGNLKWNLYSTSDVFHQTVEWWK